MQSHGAQFAIYLQTTNRGNLIPICPHLQSRKPVMSCVHWVRVPVLRVPHVNATTAVRGDFEVRVTATLSRSGLQLLGGCHLHCLPGATTAMGV